MDAGGLAEGKFLSPLSLRKGCWLAGSREGNPRACLGWVQDDTAVLTVRYDRGLDRPAGGGKVDGTSASKRLASASSASPKALTRSSSANRARRVLGSGFGSRRHAAINGSDATSETTIQFTPLPPEARAGRCLVSLAPLFAGRDRPPRCTRVVAHLSRQLGRRPSRPALR